MYVGQSEHLASLHKALGLVLTPEKKEDKKEYPGAQGSWIVLVDLVESTGREPKPVLDGVTGRL